MSDSTLGTLEPYMGDFERLKAAVCATKLGAALQLAILQHRDALASVSVEEPPRYEEYLTLHEELNPIKKPSKKKKVVDEENPDEDNPDEENPDESEFEDEVDPNDYKHCYFGICRVKDKESGKMVEVEGAWPKKRLVTVAAGVKLALQYLVNCYVNECYTCFSENGNAFPSGELMDEIKTFALENCDDPVTPFIIEVSKIFGEIGDILEDEDTKGTGHLGKYLEKEMKSIFDLKKSKKDTANKLFVIRETFVSFIKVLAVNIMDRIWEHKTALNLDMLMGTLRQLSRFVGTNRGGELPESFYDFVRMYIQDNENKKKSAAAKGKGKGKEGGTAGNRGRGRPPSKKATGRKKASNDDETDPADDETNPADDETDGVTVDDAIEAELGDIGDGEEFNDFDDFDDSPLPPDDE